MYYLWKTEWKFYALVTICTMDEQTMVHWILQDQLTLKVELLLNMIGNYFYKHQKHLFNYVCKWNSCLFFSWLMLHCFEWAARLVLALGTEPKLDIVPGSAEYAIPFSTLEDALVSRFQQLWFCNFIFCRRNLFWLGWFRNLIFAESW